MYMWKVNQAWLREWQSRWRHEWSSWQWKWVLVLPGWANLALTPGSVCSDTSVLRLAASAGDDRLVQTYSNAGNSNGSIRTSALPVMLYFLWIWPVCHHFNLCLRFKAAGLYLAGDCLGYFGAQMQQFCYCLLLRHPFTMFGHLIQTSMPAHRLCLSLKRVCFIEPTQTSVIVGLEDTSSPDLLSHSLFGTFILTSKSFSPSLSVTLYSGPPESDFWYFTLALGLHTVYVGIITTRRIFNQSVHCCSVLLLHTVVMRKWYRKC